MNEQTWAEYWDRIRAAVSEGMCPTHRTSLELAPYHPHALRGSAVGWCKVCRLYLKAGPGQAAGAESGYYLEDQRRNYQKVMGYPPD